MQAVLVRSAPLVAARAMTLRSLAGFSRVRLAAPTTVRPSPAQLQSAFFSVGAAGGSSDDNTSATTTDEDKYLELKQLRDIKSEEFYELQGKHRRYFYYIDLQGRLFLENTRPKNIATSLKSAKFLKFFFSHIRPNDPPSSSLPPTVKDENLDHESFLEYPYRSPCGREMNFIKCADRPFVFDDFFRDERSGDWRFAYGGGELTAPFRPSRLKISLSTGRLYHDGPTTASGDRGGGTTEIALIRSQLAVEFGRSITVLDDPIERSGDGTDRALVIGEFEWNGKQYPIEAIE